MALKSNDCPACGSVDTVGCWDKPTNLKQMRAVLQEYYPDARECVDCQFVWWEDPRSQIDLSKGFTVTCRAVTK